MGYQKEFNAEDYTVPEFLLKSPWVDESWHNDAMPSFYNLSQKLMVWVGEDNPDLRECGGKRYQVCEVIVKGDDYTVGNVLLETDSVEELDDGLNKLYITTVNLANLKQLLEHSWEIERDAYVEFTGYYVANPAPADDAESEVWQEYYKTLLLHAATTTHGSLFEVMCRLVVEAGIDNFDPEDF